MSAPGVRIRSLKLRLRGGDAGAARTFAKRLGGSIAERVSTDGRTWPKDLRLRLNPRPGESRNDLAQRIVRALAEKSR